MSYTALYIAFLICAILLVNCLVILARFIHQVKRPPVEEDYEKLKSEKEILEKTVLNQNEEIVEFQLRIKEFEEQALKAAQAEADAQAEEAAQAAAAAAEEAPQEAEA